MREQINEVKTNEAYECLHITAERLSMPALVTDELNKTRPFHSLSLMWDIILLHNSTHLYTAQDSHRFPVSGIYAQIKHKKKTWFIVCKNHSAMRFVVVQKVNLIV